VFLEFELPVSTLTPVVRQVVFAPFSQDNVGIYDTATSEFSTVSTGSGITYNRKYCGAATVGTKVKFVLHLLCRALEMLTVS
jgi:hypothetical protein